MCFRNKVDLTCKVCEEILYWHQVNRQIVMLWWEQGHTLWTHTLQAAQPTLLKQTGNAIGTFGPECVLVDLQHTLSLLSTRTLLRQRHYEAPTTRTIVTKKKNPNSRAKYIWLVVSKKKRILLHLVNRLYTTHAEVAYTVYVTLVAILFG